MELNNGRVNTTEKSNKDTIEKKYNGKITQRKRNTAEK